jgi:hypothetical protein
VGPLESLSEPLAADEDIRAPLFEVDMLTVSLGLEELRRILGALIVEACSARDDVRKGKINEAEAKLHMVIGCLTGLIERMKDEGGVMKNEEVRS